MMQIDVSAELGGLCFDDRPILYRVARFSRRLRQGRQGWRLGVQLAAIANSKAISPERVGKSQPIRRTPNGSKLSAPAAEYAFGSRQHPVYCRPRTRCRAPFCLSGGYQLVNSHSDSTGQRRQRAHKGHMTYEKPLTAPAHKPALRDHRN